MSFAQEPEAYQVAIDADRCIGCGACVKDCTTARLKLENGKAVIEQGRRCMECGHCVAVCPKNAVSMPGYDETQVCEYDPQSFDVSAGQFLNFLRFRRSIRSFRTQKVERGVWEELLRAGRYTPSGGNRQTCTYLILQENLEDFKDLAWAGLERLADKALGGEKVPSILAYYAPSWKESCQKRREDPEDDRLFFNAPAVLVIQSQSMIDSALASSNIGLMADAMGLGCLYSGFLGSVAQYDEAAAGYLGIWAPKATVCMLVGYPSVRYFRTVPRKPISIQWK